ncbi:hypothetical protein TrCOL_g8585, partial [Triparma columacea]
MKVTVIPSSALPLLHRRTGLYLLDLEPPATRTFAETTKMIYSQCNQCNVRDTPPKGGNKNKKRKSMSSDPFMISQWGYDAGTEYVFHPSDLTLPGFNSSITRVYVGLRVNGEDVLPWGVDYMKGEELVEVTVNQWAMKSSNPNKFKVGIWSLLSGSGVPPPAVVNCSNSKEMDSARKVMSKLIHDLSKDGAVTTRLNDRLKDLGKKFKKLKGGLNGASQLVGKVQKSKAKCLRCYLEVMKERIVGPKENAKEKTKESAKEKTKDNAKEKTKENTKEKTKENAKEKTKDNAKEKTKESAKEKTKDNAKEKTKENTKEKTKENAKEKTKDDTTNSKKTVKDTAASK